MSGTDPAPIRRIVVFNVFGHLNMGDAMLVETLIDLLRETFPGAEIRGIAFHVEGQEQWMPDIRWSQRVATKTRWYSLRGRIGQATALPIALAIAASRRFMPLRHLLPARQREGLDALAAADLAVACPGGYLEDSNRGYLLNMLQVMLAIRLARTVVLAPQSFGPVRSALGRRAIGFGLKRVDAAFPRERSSIEFVEALLGPRPANVEPSGDLAFWYDRPVADVDAEWRALGVDPARPIFGMTVLAWSFPNEADPKAAEARYFAALSRLVDRACDDGYQVVIFNQVATDLAAVDRFAKVNGRAIVDRGERDCGKLARMIAACEVFIGSRFHSCIFGLIGGVATGAIAYLPKTSGIMRDLGLSRYVRTIEAVTPEVIDGLYDDLVANRVAVAAEVRAAVARYRAENGAFIATLQRIAGGA